MGKVHKTKFLAQYGFSDKTELTLNDISSLTGTPYEILLTIFQRAKVFEHTPASTFSFHKKVRETKAISDTKAMYAVYEFLMGKVKESDKDLLLLNKDAIDIPPTVSESI